jgi:hypothetical protein
MNIIDIAKGFLCGSAFVLSILWQIYIYKRAKVDKRTKVIVLLPAIIAIFSFLFILFGSLSLWSFGLIDPYGGIGINTVAHYLYVTMIIGIFFAVKGLVNALLIGCTISWSLYTYLFHGQFDLLPIIDLSIEHISTLVPYWLEVFYSSVIVIYSIFGTIAYTIHAIKLSNLNGTQTEVEVSTQFDSFIDIL